MRAKSSRQTLMRTILVLFLLVASFSTAVIGLAPESVGASTTDSLWSGPRVYFPSTGQTLSGPFLQRWALEFEDLGLGLPVTPPFLSNGSVVQWTEFGKFEASVADSQSATAQDVARARIGQLYADKVGYTRWLPAFQPVEGSDTETRYFFETRHSLANDFLRIYEQRGNAERLGAPISEEFNIGAENYQFFEYGALTWSATKGTQFIPLGRLDAALNGHRDNPSDFMPGDIYYSSTNMLKISDAFPGQRWIEINLTTHETIAWVGDLELMRTKVVTGPSQAPTPTGNFSIYLKHEIQNLSGIGWNGQPFAAPATPWVMYFYSDYGIHGSTWRDSYGYGSGQGCVIPPNEAAEALWKWADYGTRVWVHY